MPAALYVCRRTYPLSRPRSQRAASGRSPPPTKYKDVQAAVKNRLAFGKQSCSASQNADALLLLRTPLDRIKAGLYEKKLPPFFLFRRKAFSLRAVGACFVRVDPIYPPKAFEGKDLPTNKPTDRVGVCLASKNFASGLERGRRRRKPLYCTTANICLTVLPVRLRKKQRFCVHLSLLLLLFPPSFREPEREGERQWELLSELALA